MSCGIAPDPGEYDMAGYNLSNLKVQIVEKRAYMRRVMRDILLELGVSQIFEASGPDDGFKTFLKNPADLILSDWSPGVDGIRLLHMIRRHEDSPDPYVPFIVISAHTELNDILTARDAGMTEFLAKPISPKLIYSRIRTVIEKNRIFIRTRNFFGPDRRRRRIELRGRDRRDHSNINGPERRRDQVSFQGSERRQGYSGYLPAENRMGSRPPGSRPYVPWTA